MIEIILVIAFFSLVGYVFSTVFGYMWIGLGCLFVIVASITIGALILQFACTVGAAVLSSKAARPGKRRRRYPARREPARIEQYPQRGKPQTVIQIAVSPDGVKARQEKGND